MEVDAFFLNLGWGRLARGLKEFRGEGRVILIRVDK